MSTMLQRAVAVLLASAYLAVAASQPISTRGPLRMLPGGGRSRLVLPERLNTTARPTPSQQRQPHGLAQTPLLAAQRGPPRVLPGGGRGHLVEDTTTKAADAQGGAQAAGQDLNLKHVVSATSRAGGRRRMACWSCGQWGRTGVTQQQEQQEPLQLQAPSQVLPSWRSLLLLEGARQGWQG